MTTAERMYPRELIFEVGNVVMSAGVVEDKAGELVQLVESVLQGKFDVPAKGWSASGAQLVEAFRRVADTGLADRLSAALELRNHVVHGVFLDAGIAEIPGLNWLSLKRNLGSRTPVGFSLIGWGPRELQSLAHELSEIEDLIDDEIGFAMGIKERPR